MSGARARLIINPSAGREQGPKYIEHLRERFRRHFHQLDVVVTGGQGDAERAAAAAVREGWEVLLIGGGDGTLNEALNGAAAVEGGLSQVTFGVIPLGTGNDFATALGMPAAVEDASAAVIEGGTITVDLGSVNGRLFVNTSSGGFIAEVSEIVTPEMKTIAGRLAFVLGGARAILDFEPVRTTVTAEPGRRRFGTGVYAFSVCNSRLIGGGQLIAPYALIDDGLLDLCVIDAMPMVEFAALLRAVSDGGHVEDERVRYLQVTQATLEFERTIRINTDGEVLEAAECDYRVLPRSARFFATDARFTRDHFTENA